MRSLIFILVITFTLVSCDEDVDYSSDENMVLGIWNNYYLNTDSLVMTRVFTDDYYSYFSFAEGKVQNELNKQHYFINGNDLVLDKYTQKFRILADTLWITNSLNTQLVKYIRYK